MNLADLKAFVALAETGSISRAALRLGLTQPATTRRVQNFEASMGATALLDRSTKPATLTPAGRQVLAHCYRVLKSVTDLQACARGSGEPSGDLRIGVSPGLTQSVLSAPFDELRRRYPDVRMRLTSQWTTALIGAVDRCELDCAAALLTDHHSLPSDMAGTQIGVERLGVVGACNIELPTIGRREMCLTDLSGHGWVLNPVGCGYREALIRACDREQITCRIVADVLGYDLQLSLVARGAGLGLVPRRLIDKSALRQRLRVLTVADFAPEVRVMMLRATALGSLGVAVDYLQARLATTSRKFFA